MDTCSLALIHLIHTYAGFRFHVYVFFGRMYNMHQLRMIFWDNTFNLFSLFAFFPEVYTLPPQSDWSLSCDHGPVYNNNNNNNMPGAICQVQYASCNMPGAICRRACRARALGLGALATCQSRMHPPPAPSPSAS